MKKNWQVYANVVLMVAMMLTMVGCAAVNVDVAAQNSLAIGTLETISGMQSVAQGQPGTMIYQLKDMVIMAWPKGANYGVAVLETSGKAMVDVLMINGKAISVYKLCDLVKVLEQEGWTQIAPSGLPTLLVQALFAYSVEAIMAGAQTLPTIFVVPAIFLTPEPIFSEVNG